jgi:hypothetical protein
MRRSLITIFIIWNIAAILVTNSQYFLLPPSIVSIFTPYARLTRIMQRWALFCPEPERYISSYYFEITFHDGTKTRWERPYPPNWDPIERYHAYNWQKFDTESKHMEDRLFWPGLADWMRRKYWNEKNPPKKIQLFNRVADVPPPNKTGHVTSEPKEFKYNDKLLFAYNVDEGEMQ